MASAKRAKMSATLAVISPSTGPVMEAFPHAAFPNVEFIIANDVETFLAHESIGEVTGLVYVAVGGDATLLAQLWPHCPKVTWVHSFFAGVDKLVPFVKSHLTEGRGASVPMTNGKGAFSDSLAEWAMTAILHFNKQMPRVLANRGAQTWDKFVMDTVAGKTLGVVGFGHIGQTTARMAKQGFNMKVIALRNNPDRKSDLADVTYGPADKLKLFEESDFVVCALPGTAATENFCGAAEFAAMKKTSIFLSIGRGLAVDEDALAAALISKSIGGAAVDVFKQEPLPKTSDLWKCDNLILTAHNADFTSDYFDLGWSVFSENLTNFIAQKPLVTEICKTAEY